MEDIQQRDKEYVTKELGKRPESHIDFGWIYLERKK